MLRQNMRRLFVRFIILTTLVSALFFSSTNVMPRTVHAADPVNDPFCTVCQGFAEACMETCPALGEPGHFFCVRDCMWQQRECEIQLCYCSPYVWGECPDWS
jgi:hypothetical protein